MMMHCLAECGFSEELRTGQRFKFGENWKRFLADLNEQRIREAEDSLKSMLGLTSLEGKSFLDVGSGSGLFSLAAKRLGATVHSFDYDPASVACAKALRIRYFPKDSGWTIEQGSILDENYLKTLSTYDIVYAWGVLHHTGRMWEALKRVMDLVKKGDGQIFIAIYNDQGVLSSCWELIKRVYCMLPDKLKPLISHPLFIIMWGPAIVMDCISLTPYRRWKNYHSARGMSPWSDVIDWVGGYPFEVASVKRIVDLFASNRFQLTKLRTTKRHGNNEFVFKSKNT